VGEQSKRCSLVDGNLSEKLQKYEYWVRQPEADAKTCESEAAVVTAMATTRISPINGSSDTFYTICRWTKRFKELTKFMAVVDGPDPSLTPVSSGH
jgi:hypothetical protein